MYTRRLASCSLRAAVSAFLRAQAARADEGGQAARADEGGQAARRPGRPPGGARDAPPSADAAPRHPHSSPRSSPHRRHARRGGCAPAASPTHPPPLPPGAQRARLVLAYSGLARPRAYSQRTCAAPYSGSLRRRSRTNERFASSPSARRDRNSPAQSPSIAFASVAPASSAAWQRRRVRNGCPPVHQSALQQRRPALPAPRPATPPRRP